MTVNWSSHHKADQNFFVSILTSVCYNVLKLIWNGKLGTKPSPSVTQNFTFHANICSGCLTPLMPYTGTKECHSTLCQFPYSTQKINPSNFLVDQKTSLSSWAAKYARIYEYQMPSQISKKSLFLWHIHDWQDSVSSDISSAATIPKGIIATESLIISLISMTYSPLKRDSL